MYLPFYTIPAVPTLHNILTNIGHRFGHQSGLDESSRRNSTASLHEAALCVYLVFPKIGKNTKRYKILTKTVIPMKCTLFFKKKTPAARLGDTNPYKNVIGIDKDEMRIN